MVKMKATKYELHTQPPKNHGCIFPLAHRPEFLREVFLLTWGIAGHGNHHARVDVCVPVHELLQLLHGLQGEFQVSILCRTRKKEVSGNQAFDKSNPFQPRALSKNVTEAKDDVERKPR